MSMPIENMSIDTYKEFKYMFAYDFIKLFNLLHYKHQALQRSMKKDACIIVLCMHHLGLLMIKY